MPKPRLICHIALMPSNPASAPWAALPSRSPPDWMAGVKAAADYAKADNMTLQLSALACLLRAGKGEVELAAFYDQWQHDRLVVDKWFGLQTSMAHPDRAADIARDLTKHAEFNWKNPNRFRALMGSLAINHAGFHRQDGAGYSLLADWLIRLDPVNPQTTARMCSAFQTWKRYDRSRQALMPRKSDPHCGNSGFVTGYDRDGFAHFGCMMQADPAFTFTRHNRSQRTIVILICIYAVLIGMVIVFDAAWWIMALLALTTIPAVIDIARDTTAGIELGEEKLKWHSGSRQGQLNLAEIKRFRFDTRWDFSVRVSAILQSDKRVRLPDESLPSHREFEDVLKQAGFAVERHHFRAF